MKQNKGLYVEDVGPNQDYCRKISTIKMHQVKPTKNRGQTTIKGTAKMPNNAIQGTSGQRDFLKFILVAKFTS